MEDTTMENETYLTPYTPRNVNRVHAAEIAAAGFNTQIAVWLTEHVGTMWTAYAFAVLAIIGLFAILGLLSPIVALLIAWISQTFLQLVLLPVIMVGQNVLGRKSELQADESYATTMKTYADIEDVLKHLDKQDEKILALEQLIKEQTDSILSIVQDLAKDTTQRG
jgi:ABC-type multidrug transport system fused ATPase/permease subunit